MAKNRIGGGLVALSASAIAAVYAAGFLHTQAADAALTATQVQQVPTASPAPQTVLNINPTQTPVAPKSSGAPAAEYRDGTYTGSGTSRFGDVYVSIAVQSGQISNVTITRVTTKYPVSRISSLPGKVVAQQSGSINLVSGATYSSLAFRSAVQQALAKAA